MQQFAITGYISEVMRPALAAFAERPDNTDENAYPRALTLLEHHIGNYLSNKFGDIQIDLLGHNRRMAGPFLELESKSAYPVFTQNRVIEALAREACMWIPQEVLLALHANPQAADERFVLMHTHLQKKPLIPLTEHQCAECGKTIRTGLLLETLTISLRDEYSSEQRGLVPPTPCSHPDGVGDVVVQLQVPSGRLVFANTLCPILPIAGSEDDRYVDRILGNCAGVSCAAGRKANSEFYASRGAMYLQTGNVSPTVYQDEATGTLTLKHGYIYDRARDVDTLNVTPSERNVGSICTDLRAVMAMDYDAFVACCQAKGLQAEAELENLSAFIVPVEAGTWEAVGHYENDEMMARSIFISMRRAGALHKDSNRDH